MHEEWIRVAEELGQKSKELGVQVGCVLVKDDEQIGQGWNRLPYGVDDIEERYTHRPAKYFWVEHAERVAVLEAARNGVSTNGATAYVNVTPSSVCTLCVRALAEAGITRIVGNTTVLKKKDKVKSHDIVNKKILEEAGIEVIVVDS